MKFLFLLLFITLHFKLYCMQYIDSTIKTDSHEKLKYNFHRANIEDLDIRKMTLLFACSHGYEKLVPLFLKEPHINVNESDSQGNTPLHKAIAHDNIAIQLLNVSTIDVRICNNNGLLPLHEAARLGKLQIVEKLLTIAPDTLNKVDKNNKTALHYASEYNHPDIVKLLLAHYQIDVKIKDCLGQIPLQVAALHADSITFTLLMDYHYKKYHSHSIKAIKNNYNQTLLHSAALNSHEKIFYEIMENYDFDVNVCDNDGNSVLFFACLSAQSSKLKRLFSTYTFKFNMKESDKLFSLAIEKIKNFDIVQQLLFKGYILNVDRIPLESIKSIFDANPLYLAIVFDRANDVKYFVTKRSSTETQVEALKLALSQQKLSVIDYLLKIAADYDDIIKEELYDYFDNIFKKAESIEHVQKCLIIKNKLENSLLLKRKETIFSLLPRASDNQEHHSDILLPNILYIEKERLMHRAFDAGYIDDVKALIGENVDINAYDDTGKTLLHKAIKKGYVTFIEFLTQIASLDSNKPDASQTLPLELALTLGNDEVIELLLKSKNIDLGLLNKEYRYKAYSVSNTLCSLFIGYGLPIKTDDYDYTANIANLLGLSSLAFICASGDSTKLCEIMDTGSQSQSKRVIYHALAMAIGQGHSSIIEKLIPKLKLGAQPLILKRALDLVQILLEQKLSDSRLKNYCEIEHILQKYLNIEVYEADQRKTFLKSHRARNISKDSNKLIQKASYFTDIINAEDEQGLTKLLQQKEYRILAKEENLLCLVVKLNKLKLAQIILALSDTYTKQQLNTSLQIAALMNESYDLIFNLLKYGASLPSCKNKFDLHLNICRILNPQEEAVYCGIDIDIVDIASKKSIYESILLLSIGQGNSKALSVLLKYFPYNQLIYKQGLSLINLIIQRDGNNILPKYWDIEALLMNKQNNKSK